MTDIRHIPDALAKVVHGLMLVWKLFQKIVKIDGKHRGAPEETWVPFCGIKMSCFYFLHG